MQRYKCIVSYDGTLFAGFQVQPDKRTVQSEMEKALRKMHKGEAIRVSASGRTDSRVHAKGQVIHFDSPYSFPAENWEKGMNALLPEDIAVISVQEATPDFHSRFDATGKEYRYLVSLSKKRDPFQRKYAYHFPYELNYQAMQDAIPFLLGTHDFTSFCSAKTEVTDKVRTIREIELLVEGGMLQFRFIGNGFLYNMVRILVGTLLEIGTGKKVPVDIVEILQKKDRSFAGKTVPGQGLYLWKVYYDEED
ncbi:tRNA pseudouridine(38-40) synthase TruA [Peribacillus cavernae]|uniref:tRNA pseudouridine synthase A n=1 Tax=Peribacillus cavernae TaxID=1674310 RepID=A0A3S0VG73_9BACI|nr:tRNA pseudouridine(38-40) synthase TruA [Peribacillus cavernae]MDQ0220585.1 tRNA pseudouridine38-40 synthase [Peribacillus cavernae]RUQ27353.1 tRNA pseudouridine(38-40) synthase TruA [Peribacillus cavernae]